LNELKIEYDPNIWGENFAVIPFTYFDQNSLNIKGVAVIKGIEKDNVHDSLDTLGIYQDGIGHAKTFHKDVFTSPKHELIKHTYFHRLALKTTDKIGMKIQMAEEHTALVTLSEMDPLTNIYNRRIGIQLATHEFERTYHALHRKQEFQDMREREISQDCSLLMIDIDLFKNFNDNYGHPAGDEAIKNTCKQIHSALRDEDILFKYGGEEFCVVLPGTDSENTYKVAERIRSTVEKSFSDQKPVTISIGYSSINKETSKIEDLIKQADIALYTAKENGRNRVELYNPLPQNKI
jgi:diguanylate cyclase (GGDEF)-like protein